MNDPISWDSTLVKKFSSSNHYKLLNQLKNEVIKYPLNNKKKLYSVQNKETNLDSKSKANNFDSHNSSISNNSKRCNEVYSDKSNVSFNNSKNFSIYNNNNNKENHTDLSDQLISNEITSSPTFKDRLNQVDLK